MNQPDVVIIGAGILGCAIAFELAKKGYRVLAIDKNADAGQGSTANSCGIVRAHYSTYEGTALACEGLAYWNDWENYLEHRDERGLIRFIRCGTLILKSQGGQDLTKIKQFYDQLGMVYEDWDLSTLRARYPIFKTQVQWPPRRPEAGEDFWDESEAEIPGAFWAPDEGYINDPQLSTHNLKRAAEIKGASFLFNRRVVQIRQRHGRVAGVVLDDDQQIEAPIVVNAAGPHSFIINRLAGVEAGMTIKTKALRHEVHHAPAPPGFDFEQRGAHTGDPDNGIYFRPETGNTILVGSGDPPCDPQEWVDPDHFNRQITQAQWQAQIYRLAKRIPSLPIPNQPRGLVDLYDVSDDWLPIYDKSDLPGFYMAVGTSGNQFKNAGPVGYMMAELIEQAENGRDHDRQPVTITARYTGRKLNVGFYSRLREINTESSFSVTG